MSVSAELKELAELHKSGILSDEEFQQAKNRLLMADSSETASGAADGSGSETPTDDESIPPAAPATSDNSEAKNVFKTRVTKRHVLIAIVVASVCAIVFMFLQEYWEEKRIEEVVMDGTCFRIANEIKINAEMCGKGGGLTYEKDPKTALQRGARVLKLSVDGKGTNDYSGASASTGDCLMNLMGASDAVKKRFGRTSAIQGVLKESWTVQEGPLSYEVKARWYYHPGPGLSLDFEVNMDAIHSPQCDGYMDR